MPPEDFSNYEKLRAAFEDREALYVEKGVLLVRVSNFRATRCTPPAVKAPRRGRTLRA